MRLNRKEIKSALEEGEYPATVLSAAEGFSEAGNEKVVIIYGVEGPGGVVKVTDHVVLSLDWKVNQLCEAFGEIDGPARLLIGKRCRVAIKLEQYEGRWSPKIARVLPAGAEAVAPTEDGWAGE